MALLALLVGVALVLASLLGYEQVQVAHGADPAAWCLGVEACAKAMRTPAMTLSGVPVVVWAIPLLAVLGTVLPGVRAEGDRARRARGGALFLAALLVALAVLAVLLAPVALSCPPYLALTILLLAIVGACLGSGARRPAMPQVDDWLPALLVGLTVLMGAGFAARIYDFRLSQAEEAARAEPGLALPASTEVAVERVASGRVEIPPVRSPAPIDDQDPYIGRRDADITAVVFLDLLDPASRELAWILSAVEPRFEDRVRFVTKHLPMDADCNEKRRRTEHARSCEVALALQCAHLQGGFRGYRQAILRNPDRLEEADLLQQALRLGLEVEAFRACLVSKEASEAVEADVVQAGKGSLHDPPWLFVEGRVLTTGATEAQVEALLSVVLGEQVVGDDGTTEAMTERLLDVAPPDLPAPMVEVSARPGLWIDAVEAAVDGQGRALSRYGQQPWPVDLGQARSACAAAGKRLCTREEWVSACQGAIPLDEDGSGDAFDDLHEGRIWPYGDRERQGWCGRLLSRGDLPGRTGSSPACRTPEGAFDLSGNMAEWVEEGVLLGGGDLSQGIAAGRAGCAEVRSVAGTGWRAASTGFRCCADTSVTIPADASPAPPAPVLPSPELPVPLRTDDAVGGAVLLIAWTTECAPCQAALRQAEAISAAHPGLKVRALAVQGDGEGAKLWLERSGLRIEGLLDPEAERAGELGIDGLPWMALYDGAGALRQRWSEPPSEEDLRAAVEALSAP